MSFTEISYTTAFFISMTGAFCAGWFAHAILSLTRRRQDNNTLTDHDTMARMFADTDVIPKQHPRDGTSDPTICPTPPKDSIL